MSVKSTRQHIQRWLLSYWTILLLILSSAFSLHLYFFSDYTQTQLLMSQEWRSKVISSLTSKHMERLGMISRAENSSHTVFLPNQAYSRTSTLKLYSHGNALPLTLHISESGNWEINGGYLSTRMAEFKDMESGLHPGFTEDDLELVKKLYRITAQQSRRIDIINKQTILLTGLDSSSTMLFSHAKH